MSLKEPPMRLTGVARLSLIVATALLAAGVASRRGVAAWPHVGQRAERSWFVRVRAKNACGLSAPSNQVTVQVN
jgi:hypothetical protein